MTHMFLCEAEATLNRPISVARVNYFYATFSTHTNRTI